MRLSKWSIDYYFFSFLFFCGSICSVVSQITYVKRESGGDKFGPVLTPGTNCDTMYGAFAHGNSGCECPSGKTTFISFNNSCVQNSFIKTNFGCQNTYNIITNSILVFDLDQNSAGSFGNQIKSIRNKNGMKCSVDNVQYIIGDNGILMQYGFSDVFAIDTNNKGLSWNKTMMSQRGSLHGRIIRLQTKNCKFTLRTNAVKMNPCIFFKSKGTVTIFTSTTAVKSSTASSIKTDATTAYSTSALSWASLQSVTPTKTRHVTSTRASTLVMTSVATPQLSSTRHVVVFTTTPTFIPVTSSAIPTKPSNPADNKGQKDEQSGAPVEAIVGTVAGILVIVIAIILIFFWRRRKRENTRKSSKAGNDNPTYGKNETIDLSKRKQVPNITGNELEYDYAAADGDPRASNGAAPGIYQSLIKDPNRESVYTPLERQETNEYNKVERAPFKPARNGPTDPTYNVLERPSDNNDDYLEPGSHIDKNKRPPSKPAPQNNEPVYNVLEGPNPEGEDEPEYNVLEDPDGQDDPEYNVLEDPDDNYDNAPVETARGHPSSHDNVGYASTIDFKKRQGTKNEPVYEAPEGPSSELTYQPLQINGQDNVYQPLDRTSRTIPDDQPVYHVLESQGSDWEAATAGSHLLQTLRSYNNNNNKKLIDKSFEGTAAFQDGAGNREGDY